MLVTRSAKTAAAQRFAGRIKFARLNIADYIMDLEKEGVSGLSFRYVDFIVRDFNTKPGLQAFIRAHQKTFVGSEELLERLLGENPGRQQ